MMGKVKRVFWGFMELDYKAMETYLEEMALKGWMLKKINKVFATFEKIPPKKVHFTVDIFEKAGALVMEDSEVAKEYRSLCEETGWKFIDSRRHLQFFYSEEEERPTPIQTDLETEKRIVSSSLWKSQLGVNVYQLVLFSAIMFLHYPVSLDNFQSNTALVFVVVLPVFLISTLISLVYLFLWRYRMKKSVERGEVFSNPDYRMARRRAWALNGVTVFLVLIVLFALFSDLTGGSPMLLLVLLPLGIGILIGLVLNKVIQKKANKKSQGLLYMILGTVVMFMVMSALFPAFIFSALDRDQTHLPEEYPRLEGGNWEYMEELGVNRPQYIRRESLLLPVSYEAYYYFDQTAFSYSYHQAAHQRIAAFIFQDILEDLRNPRHQLDESQKGMEELTSDHELYEFWEVDRIAYDENRSSLLLLKGQSVLRFRGMPDFSDPDFIHAVNRIFY